jgi:hypothetical protein
MFKKQIFCIFLLFFIKANASVNEPLSFTLKAGYRQNYLSWKSLSDTESELLIYQEKYKKQNMVDLEAELYSIHRDIYFSLEGGFAGLFNSDAYQRYDQLDFTADKPRLSFDAKGTDWHVFGLLGIAANLTQGRYYKWIIVPVFGYGGYWTSIKRKATKPESLALSDPSGAGIQSSYINSKLSDKNLEDNWHGPAIGAHIIVDPGTMVVFDFSYLFNWLNLHHDSLVELKKQDFSASGLAVETIITQSEKISSSSSYGHIVKAKASCQLSKKFLTSFTAKYQYFVSDKKEHIQKEIETKQVFPSPSTSILRTKDKFIIRWWYLSFVLDLSYRF